MLCWEWCLFPKLSNQAEQLVPKETGGPTAFAEWMVFMGTVSTHWTQQGNLPVTLFGAGPAVWFSRTCLYCWCSNKQPFSRGQILEIVLFPTWVPVAGQMLPHVISWVVVVLWYVGSEIGKPLVFYPLCEGFLQLLSLQVFISWPSGSDPVWGTGEGVMDETDKAPFLLELTISWSLPSHGCSRTINR